MKEGRTIQPEKILLARLQTLKGAINNEISTADDPVKEYDFKFDASIGVKVEDKVIGVKLSVDIEALGREKQKLSLAASYTHEFIFIIDNLDEFTDMVENQPEPKVDRLMLATLVGIAYSTVRGIVYTRTQGTELKGILMPVIDPKKLLKPEEPNIVAE